MNTRDAVAHMKLGRQMKDNRGWLWSWTLGAFYYLVGFRVSRASSQVALLLEGGEDESCAPWSFAEETFNSQVADAYVRAGYTVETVVQNFLWKRGPEGRYLFSVKDGAFVGTNTSSLVVPAYSEEPLTEDKYRLVPGTVTEVPTEVQKAAQPAGKVISFGTPFLVGMDLAFKEENKPAKKTELTYEQAAVAMFEGKKVEDKHGVTWDLTDFVDEDDEEWVRGSPSVNLFKERAPYYEVAEKTYTAEEAIHLMFREGKTVADSDGTEWSSSDGDDIDHNFYTYGPFTIVGG